MEKIDKIRKYTVLGFLLIGFLVLGMEKSKKDPTYVGISDGFDSEIKVTISAKKTRKGELRITSMEVEHGDTPAIADPAIASLKKTIFEKQIVEVDVVAGATYTSEGVIAALQDAVSKIETKK